MYKSIDRLNFNKQLLDVEQSPPLPPEHNALKETNRDFAWTVVLLFWIIIPLWWLLIF